MNEVHLSFTVCPISGNRTTIHPLAQVMSLEVILDSSVYLTLRVQFIGKFYQPC